MLAARRADLFHGETQVGEGLLKGDAIVVFEPLFGVDHGLFFFVADLFVFLFDCCASKSPTHSR